MPAVDSSHEVSRKLFQRAPVSVAIALLVAAAAFCAAPVTAADYSAVQVAGMNPAIAPGDDFYRFVNDGWEAAAVIPGDNIRWGVAAQLRQDNLKKLQALYEAAAKGGPTTSAAARKVGHYYVAQMDLAGREAKGIAPIKPTLDLIAALDNKTALSRYLGTQLSANVNPLSFGSFATTEGLFALYVAPGMQDPSRNMPYLLQGGLGLLRPAAYLTPDPAERKIVELYRGYIVGLLGDAGIADAAAKADQIIALETRIAMTHASAQASADLVASSQVWAQDEFASRAKGIDWTAYFDGAGLSASPAFGAWQPDAIRGISALVGTTPLEVWKAYLSFHALSKNARFLNQAMADRYFAFYDPIFIGPGQRRPLWDHAVNQTNVVMPGAGQTFVQHHFSPQAKVKAQEMVANIVRAFGQRIERLEWMTPSTKKQARAKLKNLVVGVAHPDKWPDISALEIKPDDAYGNVQRAKAFNHKNTLAKLGQPVERTDWVFAGELFAILPMPLQNSLTVSLLQLQAPYFDPHGDDAVNYAVVGARIGSAIALGFNKQGSRFDERGRVRTWWTKADRDMFDKSSAALVAQFSAYKPLPNIAVNGELTLDGNIADLAGLLAAHDAYRMTLATRRDKVDVKTADQRFFIAYAQGLRLKSTENALREQALGGPQAPATYRAATVRNIDAWYKAFDVAPGQKLYLPPAARVKVW